MKGGAERRRFSRSAPSRHAKTSVGYRVIDFPFHFAPRGELRSASSVPSQGGSSMFSTPVRKRLAVAGSLLSFALALVPVAVAGEDDDDVIRRSGGSDTGSASGGAGTGFGGMSTQDNSVLPITLAGGGMLVLSLAGASALRRRNGFGGVES